jgi:hypothetical protein
LQRGRDFEQFSRCFGDVYCHEMWSPSLARCDTRTWITLDVRKYRDPASDQHRKHTGRHPATMASFLANLGEVFRHAWLEILDSERALNEAEEGHITAMAIVFLCKSGHHRSVSFAHFFWAMVKRTKVLSDSLRDDVIMDRPRHGGICNWRPSRRPRR